MNEVSSFCTGECKIPFLERITTFDPDYPPYVPGGYELNEKTISMSGLQHLSLTYNLVGL